MPYVENRVVHDADSHLMELPDSLDEFLEARFRARYDALPKLKKQPRRRRVRRRRRAPQQDDPLVSRRRRGQHPAAQELRGAGRLPPRRPAARRSTIWASPASWCSPPSASAISGSKTAAMSELGYAAATAHNRMMTDFCSVDRRLLATGYVPLVDFERALADGAAEAIDAGRQGDADPLALPQGPFAQPHRLRSGVGAGAGGRPADPVPRRRRGEAEPRLFRERPAAGEGFPRRRGEFHLGQLHADPPFGCRPWPR